MSKKEIIEYSEDIPRPKANSVWSEKLDSYIKGGYKENPNLARMMREFVSFCRIKGGNLIEIGCGSGWFRKYIPGTRYFGLEVLLMKGVDIDFPIVMGIGEKLPFKDESFDNMLLLSTLDHVSDPPAVIKESVRCLRNDGYIYILNTVKLPGIFRKILVYTFLLFQKIISMDFESIFRNIKKRLGRDGDEYHTFEFSISEMRELLDKAGYSSIEYKHFLNVCFLKARKTAAM